MTAFARPSMREKLQCSGSCIRDKADLDSPLSEPRDRPAITAAMIEAGDEIIRQYGGIAGPSELASQVYTAMQAVRG